MAAINDLIARIQDPDLRQRIEKEVKELTKQTPVRDSASN